MEIKQIIKELQKLVDEKEIINGFQARSEETKDLEKRVYFEGFEDGQNMKKGEISLLIKLIEN